MFIIEFVAATATAGVFITEVTTAVFVVAIRELKTGYNIMVMIAVVECFAMIIAIIKAVVITIIKYIFWHYPF